jgi:hypothetical protein
MVERIGCRNARWQRIKRMDFLEGLNGNCNVFNKEINAGLSPESSLSSDSSVESNRHCSSNKETSSLGRLQSRPAGPLATLEASEGDFYQKVSSSTNSIGTSCSAKEQAAKRLRTSDEVNCQRGDTSANSVAAKNADSSLPSNARTSTVSKSTGPPKSGVSSAASAVPLPMQSLNSLQLRMVNSEQIGSYYAINEDDMIMIEDVMMCPFVYRTKNAVLCGALQDCVVPGMLRAQFSNNNNKLVGVELVFDSMGFMQQLDAGNGSDITTQVIPGSLEMALMSCTHEARIITDARAPYCILHVNEVWTRMTNYSQIECEGKQLMELLMGENTDRSDGIRPGKLIHRLEDVALGRPTCSTNIHHRKSGSPFVSFMCSYPLTK